MDIDSYQPATEAHLPPRKRRPWWRWNLITLAVVLFVLLWARELTGFEPSSAWVMAGTIFFLWAILPAPWGDWSFSTMPDYENESQRKRYAKRKAISSGCRLLAFILAIVSICQAMMIAYQVSTSTLFGGVQVLFYMLPIIGQFLVPLSQLAIAAILWLLAEALEKLDHVTNELRTQAEEKDKSVPE